MTTYIGQRRETFGVEPICQTLATAPSTYYAARSRPPSRRSKEDERLKDRITTVHEDTFEVYGVRKVWHQLRREDTPVGDVTGSPASWASSVSRVPPGLRRCARRRRPPEPATSRHRRSCLHGNRARPPLGGRPHLCLDP